MDQKFDAPDDAGWIETFTGRRFRFSAGNMLDNLGDVDIFDIAHALAHQNRYNGHTSLGALSVAEHCIVMAGYLDTVCLPETKDPRVVLTALLHDASEAYIGDMPRPLKKFIPQFKEMENRIEQLVSLALGLIYPLPPIIKECDTRILIDERNQFMYPSEHEWAVDGLSPLGVTFPRFTPEEAEIQFLHYYARLKRRVEAFIKAEGKQFQS